MATAAGMIGSCGAAFSSSSTASKGISRGRPRNRPSERTHRPSGGVRCAYGSTTRSPSRSRSGALMDQYQTLRIQPGASEGEVKKAFRKLVLQYHPDVCKGNNCVVQFHRISEAYDMVLNSLREDGGAAATAGMMSYASPTPRRAVEVEEEEEYDDGTYDPAYEMWEEWMGFEGGCTASYTAHINPYL